MADPAGGIAGEDPAIILVDAADKAAIDPDTVDAVVPPDTMDAAVPADTMDEAVPADTMDAAVAPDVPEWSPDDTEDYADREPDPVEPLLVHPPVAFRQVSNDSLSRWQLWSDQGEWLSRQPGVISFQLGGLGRNDGFLIHGHESRHQRVMRDGIPMNERIFGSANRKRLPHYSRIASVYEYTAPIRYQTEINTVRYYVTRPLTFINYEQTTYNYRSTEGLLTHNISPSTNVSLVYWGKNEDQGYRNNRMGGRNAAFSVHHFLTSNWMIEGGFHYSGLQLGEPDGYRIPDMLTFHFDRFEAFPNQSRGRSSLRNSLLRITAYHRKAPDRDAATRISVYHDRYRRFHYNDTDSSFVRTLSTGIAGRHIVVAGPFELQADAYAEWSFIDQDRFQTMDIKSWMFSEVKGTISLPLPNRSRLYSWVQSGWRTDGFADYEIGSGADWRLFRGFSIYGSFAIGEQMPRPGHLYRITPPVKGNTELQNEMLQRVEAGVRQKAGLWNLGGAFHATQHKRPVLIGRDSTFIQPGSYLSAGATGWLSFDASRIEFSISGTFQQYFSEDTRLENQLLDRSGQRMWTRASFYYKNYVYDSAAFLKAGFYVQVSPSNYRSSQYYPALDYWDPNSWHPDPDISEAQALPIFMRVDLDVTARVRSAIFLFRLENALDNWLQPGYFETAYQPMPPMRLRFGIRWVLRN